MSQPLTEEVVHAWALLMRAQRVLIEQVDSALKNAGLPPLSWYDVLLELHRKGNEGLRQYEISEKILLKKHNLSRLLDRLAAKNLIERHSCPEDARGNFVKITSEGDALLKQMWPVYARVIKKGFSQKLRPEQISTLSETMLQLWQPTK